MKTITMKIKNQNFFNCLFLFISFFLLLSCAKGQQNQVAFYETPNQLKSQLKKVADWQIKNFKYSTEGSPGYLHDYGIDAWTNATLYYGLAEWASIANDSSYYTWLKEIGNKSQWKLPENFKDNKYYQLYHSDEICMGRFYIAMYERFHDKNMILNTQERLDWIINNPPDTSTVYKNKQSWTWIDAVFMAAPVYIQMSNITGDPKYTNFMNEQFMRTYNSLYNSSEKLFYRDSSYITKKENNGKDVFWGRGNGWMAAAIADILKTLPESSPYRSFYVTLYKEYIPSLIKAMDSEYYWHASLLDPESYPSPETSATTLIAYAIAYGIESNLLPEDEYMPILNEIWKKLNTFVNEDGKLGYVQPIGADPKNVTIDMTAVYGVGAYLFGGVEIYNMITE